MNAKQFVDADGTKINVEELWDMDFVGAQITIEAPMLVRARDGRVFLWINEWKIKEFADELILIENRIAEKREAFRKGGGK